MKELDLLNDVDPEVAQREDLTLNQVQTQMLELLGAGVPAVQVASACGVSESYVSQCLADEEFSKRVTLKKSERAGQYIKHDNNIDSLEDKVLQKLERLLPLVTKPMDAARIFQTLNNAKRKSDPTSGQASSPNVIVSVELPEAAAVHFKMTAQNQVIEVEGRSMVPMPAGQVASMLRKKQTERLLEHSAQKPAEKIVVPLLDQI